MRATRGKVLRAEPVAALYEQGRVSHVGALPELEDEMSDFGADGLSGGMSPDRVDALVWALTDLCLRRAARAARAEFLSALPAFGLLERANALPAFGLVERDARVCDFYVTPER